MHHLRNLYHSPEHIIHLGRAKILTAYHNINQRFFTEWGCRFEVPPTLLTTLDPFSDFEEHSRQIRICVEKIYGLCALLQVFPVSSVFEGLRSSYIY